jgi:hypothetical protein
MPSVSPAQARFMAAVAHNPEFAHRVGVPQSVGREFNQSDAGTGMLSRAMHHHRAGGGSLSHGDPLGGLATPHAVHMLSGPKMGGAGGGAHGGDKMVSPSQGSPWWSRSEARDLGKGFAAGGGVGMASGGMADGGLSMSEESPWWERSDARIADVPFNGGLINSSGAGRTDRLPLAVRTESFVVPSAEVSGLGQGTTLAGARILTQALRIGPYGTPLPHEMRGHGVPMPSRGPGMPQGEAPEMARGGYHKTVGILAAGGEFVIPKEDWVARDEQDGKLYWHRGVQSIGGGDIKQGHERLRKMVHAIRNHTIKFLRSAAPPKR